MSSRFETIDAPFLEVHFQPRVGRVAAELVELGEHLSGYLLQVGVVIPIARNWRGQPLVSLATAVNLIGRTTTNQGLRVRAEIDKRSYPKGVVVKDEQMERIDLSPHEFHGD